MVFDCVALGLSSDSNREFIRMVENHGIIKETAGYRLWWRRSRTLLLQNSGLYALVNGVSGFVFLCLSALSTLVVHKV